MAPYISPAPPPEKLADSHLNGEGPVSRFREKVGAILSFRATRKAVTAEPSDQEKTARALQAFIERFGDRSFNPHDFVSIGRFRKMSMQIEESAGGRRYSFTTDGYRFSLSENGKLLAFSGIGDPPWKLLLRSLKGKMYSMPPLSNDDYRSTLLSIGMGSMTPGHYRAFKEQLDKSLQRAPGDIRKSIEARRAEAENEKNEKK